MLPETKARITIGRPLLGSALRERRVEVGMTLKDLSTISGISLTHVSSIETGKRTPSLDALDALACALGTTARHILRGIYPWDGGSAPDGPTGDA